MVIGLGDAITREDIKEVLATEFSVNIDKDGGDIAFITYEKGGAEAKVRKLFYSTILFKRDITDIRPFLFISHTVWATIWKRPFIRPAVKNIFHETY